MLGYTVVRNRNIADLSNPALAADRSGGAEFADPDLVVPTQPTTTVAGTTPAATTTSPASTDPDGRGNVASIVSEIPLATDEAGGDEPDATDAVAAPDAADAAPSGTFPDADPDARNFLITGADNGSCVAEDSLTAGSFGDRENSGERSDTILLVRVDPSANRVAMLSFPRDLWVELAGSGNMQRINAAYERDNPQRLADTIFENFEIPIDHYIQVDFCAFKTLVDSVGGVAIPFEFPARDTRSGLLVEDTGCVTLDGDQALAYVRSRHYEYEDPAGSGEWSQDPSSDLGRISRQQDFLRRLLATLLDSGLDPDVARGLIRVGTDYVVTDRDLTPARMLEFAGVMRDVDPAEITSYQIEAEGRTINGNAVLLPRIEGDNMQRVLALFRGDISLADAPVQQFEETTTAPPRGNASGFAGRNPLSSPDSEPQVGPDEVQYGIVPPRDVTC